MTTEISVMYGSEKVKYYFRVIYLQAALFPLYYVSEAYCGARVQASILITHLVII